MTPPLASGAITIKELAEKNAAVKMPWRCWLSHAWQIRDKFLRVNDENVSALCVVRVCARCKLVNIIGVAHAYGPVRDE